MDDLIYRQAVLEAIEHYYNDKKYITRSRTILSAICLDMKSTIDSLPSAGPEQRWIPCSERLPEEDLWTGMGKQFSNPVLMTIYDKNDEDLIVDYGHTTDGEWYSETADEYIESIADWKVIAWMPLPEPWRGEE